jgi:hypothetical protein
MSMIELVAFVWGCISTATAVKLHHNWSQISDSRWEHPRVGFWVATLMGPIYWLLILLLFVIPRKTR